MVNDWVENIFSQHCCLHFIYCQVRRVLKLLENPYSDDTDTELTQQPNREGDFQEASEASCSAEEYFSYDSKPPGWATDLRVTWSS